MIQRLLSRKREIHYPEKGVQKNTRRIGRIFGIQYGPSQGQAIAETIRSPLFILTGGPGTGKTTVVDGIVSLFAELNGLELDPSKYTQGISPILLAVPTGQTARRMNETTGLPASTIHRLPGLNGREKTLSVSTKGLEGGLSIVDEMSMVDTRLVNTLFKAIPTDMQVILVGDKDQLPFVGPDQVFRDLLEIKQILEMELNWIYRQGNDSSIIPFAREIREGRLPKDFIKNQKDHSYFRSDTYQIGPLISKIVGRAKNKGFRVQDVRVLAPMYRGPAGIDALNKMVQETLSSGKPGKKEVHWNGTVYRMGDKILQLVNTPELNVFNGDIGEITGIILTKDSGDKVDELVIQFSVNEVTYKRNEWNRIALSYCYSIHKSQDGEFKMVVLSMVHQYQRVLQRNLLYTAVTRNKELLISLEKGQTYATCVTNKSANQMTTLKSRIMDNDKVNIILQTKLAVYGDSSVGSDPSEDENYTGELRVVKEKLPVEDDNGTSETKNQIMETVEPGLSSSFVGEEKREEVEPAISKDFVLTTEAIDNRLIDPMIGMKNSSPYDFIPAKNT